jgi:hypothetical protein
MRGGALSPRLAAATPPLTLENPNEPLQGRLSLTAGGPTCAAFCCCCCCCCCCG